MRQLPIPPKKYTTEKQPRSKAKIALVGVAIALFAGLFTWGNFKAAHTDLRGQTNVHSHSNEPASTLSPSPTKPQKPSQPSFTFPGGQTSLKNKYRFVALYGVPDLPVLGALGDQPLNDSIQRAKQLAESYKGLSNEPIYPTFEIIATIAAGEPTSNNDYSREQPIDTLLPWVIAAKAEGIYVVLDLQPGRASFLSQAKLYEPLLMYPNVGLALDPEWHVASDKIPMVHRGSASAAEVNEVSQWLAELIEAHHLPQKLLLLHQFRLSMLPDRQNIDSSNSNLVFMVQMDGQGGQPGKQDTWNVIRSGAPDSLQFGWKNFYTKDSPTLTPEQTMAVSPQPWYVSYQ